MTQGRSEIPPFRVAAAVGVLFIVLMAFLHLGIVNRWIIPIGFGVPLVVMGFFRDLRLLWGMAFVFVLVTLAEFFLVLPSATAGDHFYRDSLGALAVLLDLLFIAGAVHAWIVTRAGMERRQNELQSTVRQLATREEDIARQNEELQSQTEELERQSEELRVTNEELSRRERMLQALLDLARSLRAELPRGETLQRICESLIHLVPHTAAAVLQKQNGSIRVICHHGFGREGMENETIPYERSFAALILERGRTGYLEDLSLRPELQMPQPRNGPRHQAILAAPLTVGGKMFGSLEIYNPQRSSWSDEQIALVESLASQASISLETAALFERIEQERSRLQAVVSTVPVGLTISDAAFSEVRVNPYGAMLLGVPADANLIDPQFYSRFQFFRDSTPLPVEEMPTARARRGEYVSGDEIEVALSTGRRITILANAAPIRDREGKIVGSVSAFTDITILKQLQHELDVRRREAEESASRKTRFLAAVSHDIRTPANAISLLAELIQRTAASPELAGEIPELAKELHSSAMLLVNLVSDVLDLTRLDTGKIALQESEFSFRQLMEEECKALEPLARQKGLALACRPPEQVIHLRSDRVKLGRVLANLIGNAIKFTEKGSVAVEGIREEGKLLIRVTDTGPGIPADMLERIFDEFFQLRNRNRNLDTGSGLGLTISQRLIEALGGILTVQSEPGKGSTFTIALPDSVIVPGAGK